MCDRTLEDYAEGMRILISARAYFGRWRKDRDLYWITEEELILGRAMLDVFDATRALRRGKRDARPHA
jgi:hypothetical protein